MKVSGNIKKVSFGGLIAGALVIASSFSVTGCLTDDKKDTDSVPVVVVDSVKVKSATVGAQGNNDLGSFIDLDTYTVLKQSAAEAASASVDIIFAYSGTANSSAVYAPSAAKAGIDGGAPLDIAKNLPTANATELKTIDVTKFDAVVTKAGLDSLYAAGTVAANGRLLVSKGFAFGAKTVGGMIVGMKITDVTTSATGQATIQAKAKW